MHTRIRHELEPVANLRIEIRIAQERAAIEKALPQIADRALHLAFRLRSIRPADARFDIVVSTEAQEFEIAHEAAADEPIIAREDAPHLIEQELARYPAPCGEALLEAEDQGAEVLAREELHPAPARVREDHDQGVAHAPGQPAVGEVDLRLVRRRRLEGTTGSARGVGRSVRT